MDINPYAFIVGLDPSMTATGLAIHDFVRNTTETHLIKSAAPKTVGKAKPPWDVRFARVDAIVNKVLEIVPSGSLVLFEGPAYSATGQGTHDIAGVWWMISTALRRHGCTILVVSPTSRAKYATGKGNASKDVVLSNVVKRYDFLDIDNNNVADAVVFLAMGLRLIGLPVENTLPALNLTAMTVVETDYNDMMG